MKLARLILLVALLALGCTAQAWADAPDPIPAATHGTLVTNSDGSRTLTVWGGTNPNTDPGWQWTTHNSDCNTDRSGAGYAIDWNDPTQQYNPITGKGSIGTVFVGTHDDNVVHPTPQEDSSKPAAVDSSDYTKWLGGCGVYADHTNQQLPDGTTKSGKWNQGTWGPISHTYPASVTGPISVCPVMYDVHGKGSGTPPNGAKEIIAGGTGHNGDNSIESNGDTPQGNGCFATTFGTPHLTILKQVSKDGGATWSKSVTVDPGATVEYQFTVTNDGDAGTTLTGVQVNELSNIADCDSTLHAVSGSSTLAPGQSAVFQCTHTMGSSDLTNVANASGTYTPSGGTPETVVSNNDTADVHVQHPGLDVNKTAAESAVVVGGVIHYTVTVTNTGDTPLTVTPSDTGCDGFNGSSFTLQPGASQTLNCTHTATSNDGGSYTNNACATGSDSNGGSVSDCDQVTTPVQHPAIAIDKTGPATANAGDKVTYTLTVTDPGDTSFADANVGVSDPQCNGAPVTLVSKNGDTSPGTLDPGDVWTYNCSVQTAASDTAVHNVATVVGTDTAGHTVQSSDTADTTLVAPQQAVLGERVTPGAARLAGPTGCVAKVFTARVRGTKIATVTFVLDGKVIKRFTKPTSAGTYGLRINPAKMKIGVHRLVTKVTFTKGSGTAAKTLRLSFQRCAKRLAKPRFTG
jgi:uncharacterized repeat protein (TIGR01451 family)